MMRKILLAMLMLLLVHTIKAQKLNSMDGIHPLDSIFAQKAINHGQQTGEYFEYYKNYATHRIHALYWNYESDIPVFIQDLESLRSLEIRKKPSTTTWTTISNLSQLEELRINYAQVTSIPSEIGNLLSLKRLFLEGNNISLLPAEIGNLLSLQELNLAQNSIVELPANIRHLSHLRTLNLRENKIRLLPDWFSEMILGSFDISNNELEEIKAFPLPEEIFSPNYRHTSFFFQNNKIKKLPPRSAFYRIGIFMIYGNQLSCIEREKIPFDGYYYGVYEPQTPPHRNESEIEIVEKDTTILLRAGQELRLQPSKKIGHYFSYKWYKKDSNYTSYGKELYLYNISTTHEGVYYYESYCGDDTVPYHRSRDYQVKLKAEAVLQYSEVSCEGIQIQNQKANADYDISTQGLRQVRGHQGTGIEIRKKCGTLQSNQEVFYANKNLTTLFWVKPLYQDTSSHQEIINQQVGIYKLGIDYKNAKANLFAQVNYNNEQILDTREANLSFYAPYTKDSLLLSPKKFTHIGLVIAESKVYLYKNGQKMASMDLADQSRANQAFFQIGAENKSLAVVLDELYLWKDAISEEDIAQNYQLYSESQTSYCPYLDTLLVRNKSCSGLSNNALKYILANGSGNEYTDYKEASIYDISKQKEILVDTLNRVEWTHVIGLSLDSMGKMVKIGKRPFWEDRALAVSKNRLSVGDSLVWYVPYNMDSTSFRVGLLSASSPILFYTQLEYAFGEKIS